MVSGGSSQGGKFKQYMWSMRYAPVGMGDNRLRKIADLVVLVFDQLKLRFFVTIRLETLLIDCPHRRASKRKKKKTNNKLYIYIYIYIRIESSNANQT